MSRKQSRGVSGSARKSKRHFAPRRRLALEHLEDRTLLSVADLAAPTDMRFVRNGEVAPLNTASPTGYTPAQIRAAYGFSNVSFGSVAANGTGTTIAIVDAYDDPNIANDLAAFDSYFGLPAPPSFTKVNETGGTSLPVANSGWITDIALDVEWSHAVAPGANILLVEANSNSDSDLFTAVDYARNAPGVVVVSMSWGEGESSGEASDDGYLTTPSGHAGVTFVVSSGDSGAPPQYPSISPNVLSVGGTTLANLNSSGSYSSATESGWSGSGGGISSYESQPAFQKGVVTQSTTMRTDPDVSYNADPNTGFPVYDSYNNGTVDPWGQWGGTSDAAPQWAALLAIADQGRALSGLSSLDGPTQTLPLLYGLPQTDFHDITAGGSEGYPAYSCGPGYDLVTGRGTPYANLLIPALADETFTGTALGASASTTTYGQSATLTATVTATQGTATPTGGTVTFLDSGTAIGSATLTGGTAVFTTSTLGYGVHQLTAAYSGSGTSFSPSSTASALTLTVNPASASSTSITFGSATTTYGGSVTPSASLLCGGLPVAGENISFTANGSPLASGVTNGSGVATLSPQSVAGLAAGTYSGYLGASFAGTAWFGTSNTMANLTVNPVPLTVAAVSASKVYGASDPTFSATETGFVSGQGPGNLGGTLAFSSNEPATGFAPAGTYSITPSGLTSGNYTITFVAATLTVAPVGTSTALGLSTNSSVYGQLVTLTATVTAAAPSAATPTGGTVTFMNGTVALGSATLTAGTAVLATTSLPAGTYSLSAVYNGDGAEFLGSASDSAGGGTITTVAGDGARGFAGDNGAATAAMLAYPQAVAVDASGDLFIADGPNNRIREVNSSGVITTIAGNGTAGYNGDGIQATAAKLFYPVGVALDGKGDLFIADMGNARIREVNLARGVITTVAGDGTAGYGGNGGPATTAMLYRPYGVAVDGSGHLFIGDSGNDRIREVNLATGLITTIAGTGTSGHTGDGGPATAAELSFPEGIAPDSKGNLFIADQANDAVREMNLATGLISTVAGNGTGGYNGDGGPATAAELADPSDVVVDSSGDFYIADYNNNRIREVNSSTGFITTVAGNGTFGYSGDGGPATAAELRDPERIALGANGQLYVADMDNSRIREVTLSFPAVTITVSPAPLTITADDLSMVYGAALPTLTASYTGLANGDTAASLTTALNLATVATSASGVGNYVITVNGAADPDYTMTYVSGTLTVTPAPLTVTANSQSKVYGAADPTLTYTPSGTLYYGDQYSVISGVTLDTPTGAAATAGTYTITASGGTAANYAITDVNGTLTVSQAPLTVTADDQSKVYGAADPTLTYTPSGTLYYGDQYSLITGVALSTATGASATAGTYPITASGGTAANYAITDVNGTLTVSQAPLTVTADDQSKVYGAADPTLTYTPSGTLYYGDQYSLISGVTLDTPTGAAATAGTHPITASGGMAANYAITDVNGILTVSQAPLTVTADDQSKVYGGTDPTLTYTPSGSLYYSDQYSLFTGVALSTATGASATAGTFPITASGGTAANYAITDVNGTLTVSQAPLTVTADDQSKVYGAADPTLTYTPSGTLYYGDQYSLISGVTLDTPTGAAATAGTYPITASGGTAANYAITDVNGTLTVSQAPLMVTADDQSKVYGAADPTLTYTPSGTLYYGDQYSLITGVALSTATGASATAGTYHITASGGTAANYAITDINGTLTVSPSPLTVTADSQTKAYSAADPLFTASYGGFQYGQVLATSGASGGPSLTGSDNADSPPGSYTITAALGTLSAQNYSFSFVDGTLTILPAPTFALTGPSAGTFAPGQSVTIGWTAVNVDLGGPSKISLGYDRDSTAFDANQHWLEVDGVTAANGVAAYDWNTTGVAGGTYYLSGYLYDFSTGRAVFSHLGAPIVIAVGGPVPVTAFTLTGPSLGTFSAGQSVTIGWTAAGVDVAGPSKISLGYDPDATAFDANEHWLEVDGITAANGVASYSWNTTGVASGTYYLSGYMYDFATGKAVYSHLGTSIAITGGSPPAFTLNGPSAGTFSAGQSVAIRWTATNVDVAGPTKISLGYDRDATPFDANQHWIEVDQVTAANGTAPYSWNTTGVATGTYYLSGYMYDFATSQAVYSHLGTSIVIAGGSPPAFTLAGPSAGTFVPGQSVTIGWTATNVDVAGPTKITLGYDRDTTAFDANEHWIEIDGVTAANGTASYSWNTAGVAAGTYYLSGYMYDFAIGQAVYSYLGTSIVIT